MTESYTGTFYLLSGTVSGSFENAVATCDALDRMARERRAGLKRQGQTWTKKIYSDPA